MELFKSVLTTILTPTALVFMLSGSIAVTTAYTAYNAVDEALTVHETTVEDMTIRLASNY